MARSAALFLAVLAVAFVASAEATSYAQLQQLRRPPAVRSLSVTNIPGNDYDIPGLTSQTQSAGVVGLIQLLIGTFLSVQGGIQALIALGLGLLLGVPAGIGGTIGFVIGGPLLTVSFYDIFRDVVQFVFKIFV